MLRRALLLGFALVACAQTQHSRSELEDANDSFSKAIRWSDLSSLSTRIVPDRQAEFARLAAGTDLKVTEYEMQDVAVSNEKAIVRAKVSWYREPSISTKTEAMTIVWERKNGAWLISSIVGGPLPLLPR